MSTLVVLAMAVPPQLGQREVMTQPHNAMGAVPAQPQVTRFLETPTPGAVAGPENALGWLPWWDPFQLAFSYSNFSATQWGLWYRNAALWLDWYASLMFPTTEEKPGGSSEGEDSSIEMDFFARDSIERFDATKRAKMKASIAHLLGIRESSTTLEFIPGTSVMATKTMETKTVTPGAAP